MKIAKTRIYLLLPLCILSLKAFAQVPDTIRMMQYNLMYYTNTSGVSDCNSTTNNLDVKDMHLKTIFKYVNPDVMCVCELGSNNMYADRILNNVINTDGVDYFRHGPLTNYSGGYITNMIYYDSRKLALYDNYSINTSYRDINGYTFYYNSTDLANGDTIFVTFWIAHLKAGTGTTNENARLAQAQRLMSKISQSYNPGNHIFSGDFNFYSSTEPAYKELTEYSNSLYRFYDPVNSPGYWHSNSQFSTLHTQSTRTQSDGCFVTGGLDDRFDFILVSPYLYYGSDRMHILSTSYHALGQDGARFNGSITSPANSSIPSNVANALYHQSDHLPVIMDIAIDANVSVTNHETDFYLNVANPFNDKLDIELQCSYPDVYDFELYSIDGRLIIKKSEMLETGLNRISYNVNVHNGIYLLTATNMKKQKVVKKLVKAK